MAPDTRAARDFWHGVLTESGGRTPLPRFTREPAPRPAGHQTPGFTREPARAEHHAPIPARDAAAVLRLAEEMAVPVSTVLLAAHATVLAALTGESTVTVGLTGLAPGRPLPCRLTTAPRSWEALLAHTHQAVSQVGAHRDYPVDDLRRELGLEEPSCDTALDATGPGDTPAADDSTPAAGTVLRVGIAHHDDGGLTLRMRYRTDVLDADSAARIAGYHLTALALIAADPAAKHARQSLLSDEERRFQLEKLAAGPRRSLPDAAVHELFEQRVRHDPHAVAAVHGDRKWTYRELNAHANRLARALLARGLQREDVVAVVMDRNLHWPAAVLAVFKAGGAYLPIEPHLPAERVKAMLTASRCTLVLTAPATPTSLRTALASLPAVRTLHTHAAEEEGHADDDLGIAAAADQLAYLYFTSGSTGTPKGAMCEHGGMLNHLHAKIDDLEISEGQVVAQTAPQCFDISLWQLLSALLTGGRTLLVEQDVILDVGQFLDTIARERVGVLQVVPSYLEVVLTCLEQHPRALPDLRYVSVTGEALKKELAQRWFAAQPHVKLVNAYGLTETSDDTNHEIMDRAPQGDRVPLGRPVHNVHLYVVDEHLNPVPLGAPGAIAFSGICVGRGYVNDPERTRPVYLDDPHRPGRRLYLSGDIGRWRPDGKLEFLGRRDTQVKIRGFRIETGEIENTLLRVPGVHDSAVVVAERPDHSTHLVAFYTSPRPLHTDVLLKRLNTVLPPYMVPSAVHWYAHLPLTANGKVDRKALTALATRLLDTAKDDPEAPATPTERRLAAAWARVLDVGQDRIGRHDHFFDLGGTSLTAVKLAIGLDRLVSLADITRHPVLTDLARLLAEQERGRQQPTARQAWA
jgi:amino acid adenylation domain-containing protein